MKQLLRDYILGTFNVVEWTATNKALIECPGKIAHSTKDGKRDALLTVDHNPTIHCFHSSCADVNSVAAMELKEWAEENDCLPAEGERTEEDKALFTNLHSIAAAARRWAAQLPVALETDLELTKLSCSTGKAATDELINHLFEPHDIIWVGNPEHSGPSYASHFISAEYFMETIWYGKGAPGCFISTSTFKEGVNRRTKDNVWHTPYFVVEFDKLDPDPEVNCQKSMRIINWLTHVFGETKHEMVLRAIVYSGNKSLHAWFDRPKDLVTWTLWKTGLQALGADPAGMRETQPVRLAGIQRPDTQKAQTLFYLNPKY